VNEQIPFFFPPSLNPLTCFFYLSPSFFPALAAFFLPGAIELNVKKFQAKIGMDNIASLSLFRDKLKFKEVHKIRMCIGLLCNEFQECSQNEFAISKQRLCSFLMMLGVT